MAQTPRYLVRIPPGAPVPDVGFVKNGNWFDAPSEDYVPSKTFLPCNEAAKEVLEKLGVKDLKIVHLTVEQPKTGEGVTMKELAELSAQVERGGGGVPKPAAKGGDRRL
jgi:hypothetical protein